MERRLRQGTKGEGETLGRVGGSTGGVATGRPGAALEGSAAIPIGPSSSMSVDAWPVDVSPLAAPDPCPVGSEGPLGWAASAGVGLVVADADAEGGAAGVGLLDC